MKEITEKEIDNIWNLYHIDGNEDEELATFLLNAKELKNKYDCKVNTIDFIKDLTKTLDKIYDVYVICDNYRTKDCLTNEMKYYINKIKEIIKYNEEE